MGTITVATLLTKVALDLQEPDSTFGLGLWTVDEMLGYVNYACRQFLNDTGVVMMDNSFAATIGDSTCARPANTADIDRVSFNGKRLRRVSAFDMMTIDKSWRSQTGTPKYYLEDISDIESFELSRIPTAAKTVRVFSDYLHDDLIATTDTLPVPDCWEPAIRWETMSLALQKDGENQDLPRAAWAHRKYLYFVSLAQRFVAGISDMPIPEIGQ